MQIAKWEIEGGSSDLHPLQNFPPYFSPGATRYRDKGHCVYRQPELMWREKASSFSSRRQRHITTITEEALSFCSSYWLSLPVPRHRHHHPRHYLANPESYNTGQLRSHHPYSIPKYIFISQPHSSNSRVTGMVVVLPSVRPFVCLFVVCHGCIVAKR